MAQEKRNREHMTDIEKLIEPVGDAFTIPEEAKVHTDMNLNTVNVPMLLMVFVSLPLLFLTGVSWPQSNISGFWQGVSWLFPSTFGVRAFVRMNTMGGTLSDVLLEVRCLWIHAFVYLIAACLVYGHQLRESHRHAKERLDYLRKKREVRLLLKQANLNHSDSK